MVAVFLRACSLAYGVVSRRMANFKLSHQLLTSGYRSLTLLKSAIENIENIENILSEAVSFYSHLYQAKSTNKGPKRSAFLGELDAALSEENKSFCDRPLSKVEVAICLKKLSNGKAPGIDGLPIEFYKAFWPLLVDPYMTLLDECYQHKEMPLTMRTSVITLIYKKNDRKQLKNYRPISLLCADYKIIAKVMAERMKCVIHSVIKDDQTGFIPGRNINENIITNFSRNARLHAENQKVWLYFSR
jgi:hypothetical protein